MKLSEEPNIFLCEASIYQICKAIYDGFCLILLNNLKFIVISIINNRKTKQERIQENKKGSRKSYLRINIKQGKYNYLYNL
jgi:midasin (ATPase involved in ribosome maturation)